MKILKILFLCAFCIIILISVIAPIKNRLIIEEYEFGNMKETSVGPQYPGMAELADILVIALIIDLCLIWVVVYTQILTKPRKIPYNSLVENN